MNRNTLRRLAILEEKVRTHHGKMMRVGLRSTLRVITALGSQRRQRQPS